MLFADHALRAAVELCIDKPATVAAATGGNGDVIYSPTDPISWAFQPDLPHAQRDVGAARGMIEAAGWTTSSDGIYIRDDRRLSADVYVRSNDEQRTSFMDLVAAQVRDCGIEFNVIRADGEAVVRSVESWPHHLPGTNQQFQVLFIGLAHSYDPDDPMWASDQISSDENPNGLNFIGFDNDTVDQYLTEGVATYDQRERARIYRDLQRVLAEEQPALFAWGGRGQEAIDSRLRTTDGPLDLRTALWWWQLEKLVLSD
jgi:peptide/nickel transport system substrate-binding protein